MHVPSRSSLDARWNRARRDLGPGLGPGFGRASVSTQMNRCFVPLLRLAPPLHRHRRLQKATASRPHHHSSVHVSNACPPDECSHRPRQGGTISPLRAKPKNTRTRWRWGKHQALKNTSLTHQRKRRPLCHCPTEPGDDHDPSHARYGRSDATFLIFIRKG